MARKPIPPERVKRLKRVDGTIDPRPSSQEMHERRVFVRQLHSLGMRSADIVERAIRPTIKDGETIPPRFACSEDAIIRLISEIRADLARELEVFQPTARAAGLERLYQHLLRANSELQTMRAAAKKDWASIRAHMAEVLKLENQIAKMEGTLEAIKVEHTGELNVNLQRALMSMTPEQTAQAIAEEEARLALAQGSITTTAEDVQTPAAPKPGRRQALPTPGPSAVLDRAGQNPISSHSAEVAPVGPSSRTVQRERSSDIAARREVRSPMDADVEARPGSRGISTRVIT